MTSAEGAVTTRGRGAGLRGLGTLMAGIGVGCFLAACALGGKAMSAATVDLHELVGSEWVAQSIEGAPVLGRARPTLRFAAADRVSGDGACNQFSGALAIDGQTVRVGPATTTQRACAPAVMGQERRYLAALEQAHVLLIDGTTLALLDQSRTPLLRMTRVLAPPS
jgi:heat shock protein HslJ